MYRELVTALRKRAVDLPEKFSRNAENVDLLMKASDAIEELSMKLHGAEAAIAGMRREIERMVIDSVNSKPHWISVDDRLPQKENRTYWICTDTGYQCECRWTNNRFGIGESDEWGWSIADVPQYHKVVAWMFLPEPYEPPKEDEQ